MKKITFITGNPKKAEYLARYLDFPIEHRKIELEEIQSLDLREIVEHKVMQAYNKVKWPVLVEDVSLEFKSLWKLPGPFINFFEQELWSEGITQLLADKKRDATARCVFWFYNGIQFTFFEWSIAGTISDAPRGKNGFGWDQIFIPYFTDRTAAELDTVEYERFYTEEKPFEKIREFLLSHNS